MARRRYLLFYLMDLAGLTGALLLADWVKRYLPLGQTVPPETVFITPLLVGLLWGLWSFYARLGQLYNPHRDVSIGGNLGRVAGVLFLTGISFVGVVFLLKYHHLSRLMLLYFGILALVFLTSYRLALWATWRSLRELGYGTRRVLVAGAGDLAQRVASALERESWTNVQVVGFLEDRPPEGFPVLGHLRNAERMVRQHQVDEVVVALGETRRREVLALVQDLQWTPVRVTLVPDYLELATVEASIREVSGIPLVELRAPVIEGVDALVKRAIDLIGAIVALLTLWPVMLVSALAIKLSSPGPVLFRQTRVGENGRLYTLHKFRTMQVDAPSVAPVPDRVEELGKATLKRAPDSPYVTRVGSFLRRYSLDELPQFWNVLKGEMSLVGPRPEVPDIVRLYNPWHLQRLAVKPGLTGPMQVNGRCDLPLDDRVKLEMAYMQNYSLWADLKLIAKTFLAVVSPRGAA
ncbi:MAG: sugar transferase [Dehalococcoidia bacterium]